MMLIDGVKELSKSGEVITGDKKECFIVDKIKEFLEEKEQKPIFIIVKFYIESKNKHRFNLRKRK